MTKSGVDYAGYIKMLQGGIDHFIEQVDYQLNTGYDPRTDPSKFILELTGERERGQKADIKRCPICRGVLVERTVYSKFYGCSNYPKCGYKLKVKGVKEESV
jgi:hypothetical protein